MYVTRQRDRTRRGGFTLLELLIVLAIIGIIAAMVVPGLLGRQQVAQEQITRTSIHNLEQALKLYAVDHDAAFPEGGQEVYELLMQPTDRNGQPMPAYLEELPTDAWDELLYYQYPPTHQQNVDKPDIWSSGRDRQDDNGAGDDISNWEEQEDNL